MKKKIVSLFTIVICIICTASLQANPIVRMETNLGNIDLELYRDATPVTVDNFLGYVNSGFYNNLLFHRVIKNFIIQGGGFYKIDYNIYPASSDHSKIISAPIINESFNGLSNVRGTIAMARTSSPNSATSEFFINHADNLFLDKANATDGVGYCVFGKVVEGLSVVDSIAQVQTTYVAASFANFPYLPPVVISNVYLIPEPCTLVLLALGGMMLRKFKS